MASPSPACARRTARSVSASPSRERSSRRRRRKCPAAPPSMRSAVLRISIVESIPVGAFRGLWARLMPARPEGTVPRGGPRGYSDIRPRASGPPPEGRSRGPATLEIRNSRAPGRFRGPYAGRIPFAPAAAVPPQCAGSSSPSSSCAPRSRRFPRLRFASADQVMTFEAPRELLDDGTRDATLAEIQKLRGRQRAPARLLARLRAGRRLARAPELRRRRPGGVPGGHVGAAGPPVRGRAGPPHLDPARR